MTPNPFDPKYLFFAKHAQHVALVHFPIALFITGAVLDFLGTRKKRRDYEAAAYFNFWGAALFTVPVVATGIAAWQLALKGQTIHGILELHMIFAAVSTLLIWIVLLIHRANGLSPSSHSLAYRLLLEAIAAATLILTGHLGGFLSGVNVSG